jgi:hypothetical protein
MELANAKQFIEWSSVVNLCYMCRKWKRDVDSKHNITANHLGDAAVSKYATVERNFLLSSVVVTWDIMPCIPLNAN